MNNLEEINSENDLKNEIVTNDINAINTISNDNINMNSSTGNQINENYENSNNNTSQVESDYNSLNNNESDFKFELNGNEQVVYEYQEKKSLSLLIYIIFFIFIGLSIIFLPQIHQTINNFKNGKLTESTKNNTNNINNTNPSVTPVKDNDKVENKYYELSEETIISIDKLTLSNFKKESANRSYYISFDIENKDNKSYDYSEKIFIQFFNNGELLSSSLLESDKILLASEKNRIRILIPDTTYARDFKISLNKIKENDYPEVNLITNLKDQQELTCALENQVIKYTFSNNELIGINDVRTEYSILYLDNYSYLSSLSNYRNKVINYNNILGINSSINENENGFVFVVNIDPITITNENIKNLNEKSYYIGKTKAKVISFEMKSRGYNCN